MLIFKAKFALKLLLNWCQPWCCWEKSPNWTKIKTGNFEAVNQWCWSLFWSLSLRTLKDKFEIPVLLGIVLVLMLIYIYILFKLLFNFVIAIQMVFGYSFCFFLFDGGGGPCGFSNLQSLSLSLGVWSL